MDTVSDSAGDAFAQAYDPWGDPLSTASGTALSLTRTGYTAHQHDTDLGLVDMRGRVYDPLAARFMTPDPVMQAPYWSQGLNRYAYVFNDPVNNTDPSGFTAARDAAAIYAPFHVGAGMTAYAGMSALGSVARLGTGTGLGALSTPVSVGRTLTGSGLGGGRASTGTQTVTPTTAVASQGHSAGSPHAVGQVGGQVGAATGSAPSSGWTSEQLVEALHGLHERRVGEVRESIASAAENLVLNSDPNDFKYSGEYAEWGCSSNKCNALVAAALRTAGVNASGRVFPRPPLAGEWARGSNLPPEFSLVPRGDAAMRGDIVAQARNYGPRGASGHTGIMTSSTNLIHATGEVGLGYTTLAKTFPENNPIRKTHVRFIRYTGAPNPWVF